MEEGESSRGISVFVLSPGVGSWVRTPGHVHRGRSVLAYGAGRG